MRAHECDKSLAISQAIKRCEEALEPMQAATDATDKLSNPDVVCVLNDAKLTYQRAINDLVKDREQHQSSCTECGSSD